MEPSTLISNVRLGFLTLSILLSAEVAWAEEWRSIGPDGGPVSSLLRDPGTSALYCSAGIQIYKSLDDGLNWFPASFGLESSTPTTLASTAGVLLAATPTGLFRSVDAGQHWSRAGDLPGVPWAYIGGLEVDPRMPGTVYVTVGTSGREVSGGVLKSTDAGVSWVRTGAPQGLGAISVDPINSDVYGSDGFFLYRSQDGGLNWTKGAEVTTHYPRSVSRIVRDPASSTIYIVSISNPKIPGGLFRSDDGGTTLDRTPLNGSVTSFLLGPSGDLFAGTTEGLFVSRDRGASWASASGLPPIEVDALVGGAGNEVLAGTAARGVYASEDTGLSWTPRSRGLRAMTVDAIAIDPVTPTTIWVASGDVGGGVWISRDGGAVWTECGTDIWAHRIVKSLVVDPSFPLRAFAVNNQSFGGFTFPGGVFRTDDGGLTWSPTGEGLPPAWKIAIDPQRPSTLYVAGFQGIYRSVDAGGTWSLATRSLAPNDVVVDPAAPSNVFAGNLRSPDHGLTWTAMSVDPLSLAVGSDEVVWAGTATGVFQSADGGSTFVPKNRGIETASIRSITLDNRLRAVYAATSFPPLPGCCVQDGGVFVSRDNGDSWQRLRDGLPTGIVPALAVDQTSGAVYAGTAGAGLFRLLEGTAPCASDGRTLCLGGRFRAQVSWRSGSRADSGQARTLTSDAGAFWFFSANNLELVVKVVDGRSANGHFWIFGAGLTDLEYDLAITDTTTGVVWTHHNAQGMLASFADTLAF